MSARIEGVDVEDEHRAGAGFRTRRGEAGNEDASTNGAAIRLLLQQVLAKVDETKYEITARVDKLDVRIDGQIERINKRIDPLEQRVLRDEDRDSRFMKAVEMMSDISHRLAIHEASGHPMTVLRLEAFDVRLAAVERDIQAFKVVASYTQWLIGAVIGLVALVVGLIFNII